LPVYALGSGSDYSPFIDHLGITTLAMGYGGEAKQGGVYHSRYDTFQHHTRFEDPGMVYGKVLAETFGHAVLDAADTGLPLQDPTDFAGAVKRYADKVEKLAKTRRKAAHMQQTAFHDNAYAIAADPTEPHGTPVPLKPVPEFDFSPLDHAVATLNKQAKAYESALASTGSDLSSSQTAKLQKLMGSIDQTLLADAGLPGRPWYKNLIYAPGRYIGYGVTTLPGVTEAITDERWDDVSKYIKLTADALQSYSARLSKATKILKQAQRES
jgi:N-acetylated-alpha-linked acidic dipeptidase